MNLWATGLAIGHFLLSPGIFSLQYTLAGLLFWLVGWRVLRSSGTGPGLLQLVALALASTVFVALCETGWLWAWQRVPPAETLETLVAFEDEMPPPWIVLAAGLAAMAVAVVRARLSPARA